MAGNHHLEHHVLYLVGKNSAGFVFKRVSTRTEEEAKIGMPKDCAAYRFADVDVSKDEMKIMNESPWHKL